MKKQVRYLLEIQEQVVRSVYERRKDYESQWVAIVSIAWRLVAHWKLFVPGYDC